MQVYSVNGSNSTNFKAFVPKDLSERLILQAKNMGVLNKYNTQVKKLENYGNQKTFFTVLENNGKKRLALSNPYSYKIESELSGIKFIKSDLHCNEKESLIEQFLSVKEYMIDEAQKILDSFVK